MEPRDRINTLLAEYKGLKDFIHIRINHAYQIVAFGTASIVAIVVGRIPIEIAIFLIGLGGLILFGLLVMTVRDVRYAQKFIVGIESRVNDMAKEELLTYERDVGGPLVALLGRLGI